MKKLQVFLLCIFAFYATNKGMKGDDKTNPTLNIQLSGKLTLPIVLTLITNHTITRSLLNEKLLKFLEEQTKQVD